VSRGPAPSSRVRLAELGALPTDVRSWVVTFVAVVMAYLLTSHALFLFYGVWQIPLFVGVLAAMIASSYLQAGLVAVGALTLMQLISPPVLIARAPLGLGGWVLSILLVAAASTGVGYVRAAGVVPKKAMALVVSVLLVVWAIVNLWVPLLAGGIPLTGYGTLHASDISAVPQAHQYVNDDAIYRRVFYLMHSGEGYYQAFRDAWLGLKQAPPLPQSVTAYRLPTMYWLWTLLPDNAFLIATVFLAFASIGAVAAAFITGQLVGVRFAPLAALALVGYAAGSALSVYLTYIDLPAMCMALVGIALFARASISDDDRFLYAAASVLALAALTREILAYLIVFAALSCLLQPAGKRLRRAIPWLIALGVFAVGYSAHAFAVQAFIANRTGTIGYLGGSPSFALDAIRRFSDWMTAGGIVLPLLFLLGVLGALGAEKRAKRPFSAFAFAALVVPILAMIKLGNPGIDAAGLQVNYWGNLFVPLALSLWPVAAILLPSV
jgi:hypothetical protein